MLTEDGFNLARPLQTMAGKHAVETFQFPAVETSTSGHHALVLHQGLQLGRLTQDLTSGLLDPLLANTPPKGGLGSILGV